MWVKNHGGKKDDVKVLMDNVTQLLNSPSMKQYQEKYGEYSVLWGQPFEDYFDREFKNYIPKYAAKFHTQKFAAFRNDITATNNISESMNKKKKEDLTSLDRKNPRADDYDYSVNPAPDSMLATSLVESPVSKDDKVTRTIVDSSEMEDISFHEATGDTLPHRSTPKADKKQDQYISYGKPWNTPPNGEHKGYMKKLPVVLQKSLNPTKWVPDEVIDEAISNFICQNALRDKILLCPTFIYKSVALGNSAVFYGFLDRNGALNKDFLTIPFNTDIVVPAVKRMANPLSGPERSQSVPPSKKRKEKKKHIEPVPDRSPITEEWMGQPETPVPIRCVGSHTLPPIIMSPVTTLERRKRRALVSRFICRLQTSSSLAFQGDQECVSVSHHQSDRFEGHARRWRSPLSEPMLEGQAYSSHCNLDW
ncbi:UNVERIFIED_CONTAM: hypothetical protein K2H54_050376 [Gekko kuhli]